MIFKNCIRPFVLFAAMHISSLFASPADDHRHALFSKIQPTNVKELLLFASLYPDSEEGKEAQKKAWGVLSQQSIVANVTVPPEFTKNIPSLISLINPQKSPQETVKILTPEVIAIVETIGKNLPHRKLAGHKATSIEDVAKLPLDQIDITRAVLLLNDLTMAEIKSVEASFDLLALQIVARLPPNPSNLDIVHAINTLLFFELGIRFPPEDESESKTKSFSDISTILFSRKGICLGASVTYLCLSERLNLPLSIYTPPGHIFIALEDETGTRTIETTARGIHIPIEEYYGLTLQYLPKRTLREVIGMILYNTAAQHLHEKEFFKALKLYKKASTFEDSDELSCLKSLSFLLTNDPKNSQKVAQEELLHPRPYLFERDILLHDLAEGFLSTEGAKALIAHTKDDEASLLKEITELTTLTKSCPNSLCIPFHLAHAYLALGNTKKALPYLETITTSKKAPASVHVLLATVYENRSLYANAWEQVAIATKKYHEKNEGLPQTFVDFAIELHTIYPNKEHISQIIIQENI